ncbi:fatty acid hydroxylase [Nitritalea halalkaliphila LW7]|uniref:Fatty acid hydroxylase n=1 Tax=Nitritalea halalkaliphila LW7 TaxID=1189621 RepID=I5C9M6_9BACT|nr:sterol desaturase family protein [Nitritalea halalkaliphila]EIM78528.1 fatty acid hydroxylase [Nitritalea halalkaliphila LW7]
MENIINYFETIPSSHRTFLLVGGLTFFWVLEYLIPLFTFSYTKWKHARTNLFLTLTTVLVNLPLAFILVKASDWVVAQEFGLLYLAELPLWAFVLLGILLMDLIGAYFIHWLEHQVKWMWQFHLVHHTDRHVDTTSANRHHPGESVLRFVFTLFAVFIVGAPIWMVMMYQSLSVVLTQFNHSNVALPLPVDRVLGWVFCTPGIHRVHHHEQQPLTDCNYGNIFSFWDRLFGTYRAVDNRSLRYGLDTHPDPKESDDIWTILKLPFQPYRQAPRKSVGAAEHVEKSRV